MNKFIIPFILSSFTVNAQVTLTESNLPIVIISHVVTDTIKDDPRIFCHMGIIDNGLSATNYVTDPFNDYDGQISIEIRGSTSQQYPKKNYGIETQDAFGNNLNVSILGMPVENDWILYGPYPDKTCIRDALTMHLWSAMDHYASRTVYCELVENGEYKGLYVFMEKMKRDNDRIDISKLDSLDISGDPLTGGYVVKVDKPTGSVVETWPSAYNPEVLFQYHDPAPEDLLPVQKSYIQSYISDFEDMLWGPDFADHTLGYHDVINKLSFYDFFIMEELGRTVDGYRSSSFLFKDKTSIWGGYLNAGPIWDFNLSYGNADYCDAFLTTGWQYEFDLLCPWFTSSVPFWWGRLLEDTAYCNGLQCRWQMLREGPFHVDSIHNYIDSVASYIQDARIRNFDQWPIIGVYVNWNGFVGATYDEDLDYLKTYIANRMTWMDANIPGTCWPGLAEIEEPAQPEVLSRAWPNPFNELLYLGFTSKTAGPVNIEITSADGRRVEKFDLGNLSTGNHIHEWNSSNVPEGIYLYSIYVGGELIARDKLVRKR